MMQPQNCLVFRPSCRNCL